MSVRSEGPGGRDMQRRDATFVRLPPFAALLHDKRLVPSTTSKYLAVDQYLLYDLMLPHLLRIPFDENWYLETYPDVREAIGSGLVASALQHYARYGYYENRMPRRIVVDETWYLETHKDVRDAVARGVFSSGQDHFMVVGFREGRLPYANFRLIGDVALAA
ncbi:MAG: hypothetical protein K2X49_05640 [Acetobacteraceae bacterium]|nr:hypothetical protein [Acetobacteraceae bacterium]